MHQPTRPPWRRFTAAPVSAGVVGAAAAGSAVAHVIAAASGLAGVMAWWMAAMGAACLTCAGPMLGSPWQLCAGQAARRAAGHLMAMSAAMILIHLVLLLGPGAGSHHGNVQGASSPGHESAMLALICIELLCLMAASAALRLTRVGPSVTIGTAVPAAVERCPARITTPELNPQPQEPL